MTKEVYCDPKLQGPKFLSSSASLPRIYYDLTWKRKHTLKAPTKEPAKIVCTLTNVIPPSVSEEIMEVTHSNLDISAVSTAAPIKKRKKSKKT